jgi:beta-ribofuranosylaminobenzene 5'-phosphate synthase
MMGHDGSMTKLLELVVCEEARLRTILQHVVPCPKEPADRLEVAPGEPANEREILIITSSGNQPLLHARSYTPLSRLAPSFKDDLMRADMPIGRIMQKHRMEARREVLEVGYKAREPALSELMGREGPYLWRVYNIIVRGKPLITIEESFPIELLGNPQSS